MGGVAGVEEVAPLRDVPVAIHTAGRAVGRAWLLRSGEPLASRPDGDYLAFTVPRLEDYEAVCIELGG